MAPTVPSAGAHVGLGCARASCGAASCRTSFRRAARRRAAPSAMSTPRSSCASRSPPARCRSPIGSSCRWAAAARLPGWCSAPSSRGCARASWPCWCRTSSRRRHASSAAWRRKTLGLLRRHDASLTRVEVGARRFSHRARLRRPGYGSPTEAGRRARDMHAAARRHSPGDDLHGEMPGGACSTPCGRATYRGTVLFWNTYSSVDPARAPRAVAGFSPAAAAAAPVLYRAGAAGVRRAHARGTRRAPRLANRPGWRLPDPHGGGGFPAVLPCDGRQSAPACWPSRGSRLAPALRGGAVPPPGLRVLTPRSRPRFSPPSSNAWCTPASPQHAGGARHRRHRDHRSGTAAARSGSLQSQLSWLITLFEWGPAACSQFKLHRFTRLAPHGAGRLHP